MQRYLVIIEKSPSSFSAYTPDLPGCVAIGETIEEVEERFHAALRLHLDGLEKDDLPFPKSATMAEYLLID